MVQPAVQVSGMRELRAALRRVDESLVDVVTVANKKAATVVVDGARRRAPGVGRQAARAAGQLKVTATPKSGRVTLANSRAVPYAIGAEFGATHNLARTVTRRGKTFQMRGWNQLPVRTPAGRFLWPTIRAQRDEIVDTYEAEVERLLRRHGLDVR